MVGKTERHHYVPASHLREYTNAQGRLWMFDRQTGTSRDVHPEYVAKIHDYYRVDEHEDPRIVETHLQQVEGDAAAAVKVIVERRALPQDELTAVVIRAAAQVSRVPAFRDRMSDLFRQLDENAQSFARSRDAGLPPMPMPGRSQLIGLAMKGAADVIDALRHRHWILLIVEGSTELITSDNPVIVVHRDRTPPIGSMGFALGNTLVAVPLTRSAILVGAWERPVRDVITISRRDAANFNGAIAHHSSRFIFSTRERFRFLTDEEGRERNDPAHWKLVT